MAAGTFSTTAETGGSFPPVRVRKTRGGSHADFGVDGPRRGDDVLVVRGARLARVGDLPAVAHQEAPVVGDPRLVAGAHAHLRGVQRGPARPDRRGDAVGHLL